MENVGEVKLPTPPDPARNPINSPMTKSLVPQLASCTFDCYVSWQPSYVAQRIEFFEIFHSPRNPRKYRETCLGGRWFESSRYDGFLYLVVLRSKFKHSNEVASLSHAIGILSTLSFPLSARATAETF